MSYREFYNDFNKEVTNSILFFYGEENFLINWAIELVLDRETEPDTRDFTVVELNGDECTVDEIIANSMTGSLFGGKRIVLIRNFSLFRRKSELAEKQDGQRLLEFIGKGTDAAVVVFYLDDMYLDKLTALGKKIAEIKRTGYQFNKLTPEELRGFIRKRISEAGKFMSDKVLEHTLFVTGYHNRESEYRLTDMDRDIVKLVNSAEGEDITAELVDELLVGDNDKFVFNMIDALIAEDRKKAMQLTTNILNSKDGEPMQLIGLLTSQFEIMYDALDLESSGLSIKETAKRTGINEYRFKNAYKAARRFNKERIKELLTELYDIDKSIKTGSLSADDALMLFIFN